MVGRGTAFKLAETDLINEVMGIEKRSRFRLFAYICCPIWSRISMDRISDSDSEDVGSIPTGTTIKYTSLREFGEANPEFFRLVTLSS